MPRMHARTLPQSRRGGEPQGTQGCDRVSWLRSVPAVSITGRPAAPMTRTPVSVDQTDAQRADRTVELPLQRVSTTPGPNYSPDHTSSHTSRNIQPHSKCRNRNRVGKGERPIQKPAVFGPAGVPPSHLPGRVAPLEIVLSGRRSAPATSSGAARTIAILATPRHRRGRAAHGTYRVPRSRRSVPSSRRSRLRSRSRRDS